MRNSVRLKYVGCVYVSESCGIIILSDQEQSRAQHVLPMSIAFGNAISRFLSLRCSIVFWN